MWWNQRAYLHDEEEREIINRQAPLSWRFTDPFIHWEQKGFRSASSNSQAWPLQLATSWVFNPCTHLSTLRPPSSSKVLPFLSHVITSVCSFLYCCTIASLFCPHQSATTLIIIFVLFLESCWERSVELHTNTRGYNPLLKSSLKEFFFGQAH